MKARFVVVKAWVVLTPFVLALAALAALAACGEDGTPAAVEPDAAGPEASPPEMTNDAAVVEAAAEGEAPPIPEIVCDASPCVRRIVAGSSHYCALLDDRTVRCWGAPALVGAGADAGPEAGSAPVRVDGVTDVVDIAAASGRTCAVIGDGGVDCWGADQPAPTRVPDLAAVRVAPASTQTNFLHIMCAIGMSGTLTCKGDSYIVTFGGGSHDFDLGGRSALAVSFTPPDNLFYDSATGFVVDSEHTLRSWGYGTSPTNTTLGRTSTAILDYLPRKIDGLPPIRGVTASSRHVCAVSLDGRVFCWGEAEDAMLGVGYLRDELYPVEVFFADRWLHDVSTSATHSCASSRSGQVHCWGGRNSAGERGVVEEGLTYEPVRAKALGKTPDVVAVATGVRSTCTLARSGAVHCWGANDEGQLGRGTRDGDRHPEAAPVAFPEESR